MTVRPFSILVILLFILTGCSPLGENSVLNWQSDLTSTVSGKAEMFSNGGMSAQSSCSNRNVVLYPLDLDGSVIYSSPSRSVPLNADGSFQFKNLKSFGINPKTEKIAYILRIEACGEVYSRPLTGLREQDITVSSSLIEKINSAASAGMNKLNQLTSKDIESLVVSMNQISATSVSQTYDAVLADSITKTSIQDLFNVSFEEVKDLTPPDIKSLSLPSSYAEASQASFSVVASHWYKSFLYAYEWNLGGAVVSHSSNYSFVPSKNYQGTHSLILKVGVDDGTGNVDLTKPYVTQNMSVNIPDTFPAVVPPLTLTSPSPTNSLNANLSLATGASLVNCETFNSLAITENTAIAPLDPALYSMTCTSTNTQALSYTLSPGDGLKSLRMWARDSAGNISSTSQNINILIDQTPPEVSFGTLSSGLIGGSNFNIPYSATDATSGLQSVLLYFSPDGTTFNQIADLSSSSSPYSWTIPLLTNTSSAKLKLVATDKAGNSQTITSNSLSITAPPLSLAFVTPANSYVNLSNVSSFPLSGTCATSGQSTISISVDSINGSTTCSSGMWSLNMDLSAAPQGNLNVSLTQNDSVGNPNTISTVLIKDSIAPSVTLTSLTGGQILAGGTLQTISWTASDNRPLPASPIKIEYSTNSGTSWSTIVSSYANAGSYSWVLPTITSDFIRVRITATDGANNSASNSSSTDFAINSTSPTVSLTSMTGGQYLSGGSTQNITWSASGNHLGATPIKLEISSDSGSTWSTLTAATANSGNYSWSVPSLDSSSYRVRVTVIDQSNLSNSATSSANLTLDNTNPTLSLTKPSASDIIVGGSVFYINWTASDTNFGSTPLKFEYSINSGTSWTTIITSTSNAGNFAWSIPTIDNSNVTLRATATDLAGRQTQVVSSAFTIDSTPPSAPSATLASAAVSSSTSVALNVTCTADYAKVLITESSSTPLSTDPAWKNCASSMNFTIATGDGTHSIKVWTKDLAGNISSTSTNLSMILDQTAPTLSLTSTVSALAGGSSKLITWSATDANFSSTPIKIEYSQDNGSTWSTVAAAIANSSNSCSVPGGSTGCYNWTIPSINSTQVKLKVTAIDLAAQSSSLTTATFIVDSTDPIINNFAINSGNPSTTSGTILTALSAQDDIAKITYFCFKSTTGVSTTAPTAADSCWTPVNGPLPGVSPAINISFNNFYYPLGLNAGTYKVFAWTKNEAGRISTLSNSGNGTLGVDMAQVQFLPGNPPSLDNVISVNSDSHSTPPASTSLTATAGQTLYIKWKASADSALPNGSISIFYTTNDSTFTSVATGLNNQANGSCTVDGINYTGCSVITAPVGTYFKIRVAVTDVNQKTTMASAVPNNTGNFHVIAGNTDVGLGGSASAAIFNIFGASTTSAPGTFVMTDNGTFFVRDQTQGILKIDPNTGIVTSFLKVTGTATDGPLSSATLKSAAFISLGYNNNLLIWDSDRIRQVNLSTNTVSTLIGGGASRTSGATAANFQGSICTSSACIIMFPLPNGDIYFKEVATTIFEKMIWHYSATDGKVYALNLSGTGMLGRPAGDDVSSNSYRLLTFGFGFDVTTSTITTMFAGFYPSPCPGCGNNAAPAFIDPTTGNTITSQPITSMGNNNVRPYATARDGKIYSLLIESSKSLYRYEPGTNSWTKLLGTGSQGYCPDGTDALSCNIFPGDVFVTSDSRIFFTDNGLIRTIDSSNKIRTIFGQRLTYGDGGIANSARIHSGSFFDFNSAGDIVFFDNLENVIRKFTPDGTITNIAGNGNNLAPNSGALAATSSVTGNWWGGRYQLQVDRSNDDIYVQQADKLMKISNADKKFYTLIGGGSTLYDLGDGLPGANIKTPNEYPEFLGIANGRILLAHDQRDASAVNVKCYMKEYDMSDSYRQIHFAGSDATCAGLAPDGTPVTSATTGNITNNPHLMTQWNSDLNAWIVPWTGTIYLKYFPRGGNVTNLVTLPRAYISFSLVKNGSNQNVIYYCSTLGRVYKYNMATSTETTLPWAGSYSCTGSVIRYSASRGSVVFPASLGGVISFVEIIDTP